MKSKNNTISSITTGPRQSNIELLRILAMFLVLVVHAAFFSTGHPSAEEFYCNPIASFTRTAFESVSIVCVNVFILISGWFGIKPSVKGLSNFLFQCAFFLFGIYTFLVLTRNVSLSLMGIAGCFCLTHWNWFIKAYVALYLLAPILNIFIEKTSKKQFKSTLTAFFIFQTIWGWSGAARFIEFGYSCFSFIGLYLLARYLKIYGAGKLSNWGGASYIVMAVLNTIGYYINVRFHILPDIYAYINPMVIFGSLGLLLFFDRVRIKPNKTINWIAKSAFAVFLLHTNPNIIVDVFQRDVQEIYSRHSCIECVALILGYLLIIYMIAILIDQPRKYLWNLISKRLFK